MAEQAGIFITGNEVKFRQKTAWLSNPNVWVRKTAARKITFWLVNFAKFYQKEMDRAQALLLWFSVTSRNNSAVGLQPSALSARPHPPPTPAGARGRELQSVPEVCQDHAGSLREGRDGEGKLQQPGQPGLCPATLWALPPERDILPSSQDQGVQA